MMGLGRDRDPQRPPPRGRMGVRWESGDSAAEAEKPFSSLWFWMRPR